MNPFFLFYQWFIALFQKGSSLESKTMLPIRTGDNVLLNPLADSVQDVMLGKKIILPHFVPFIFHQQLAKNAHDLFHVFYVADMAAQKPDRVTIATEWLIDNYYTIDKAILQTQRSFPREFLRHLPHDAFEPHMPRILTLAWLYVAHTDSQFSLVGLTDMVKEAQKIMPLQIGELWALPSALRFVLIENARRIASSIIDHDKLCQKANETIDKLAAIHTKDARKTQEHCNALLGSYESLMMNTSYFCHLLYRLRSETIDKPEVIQQETIKEAMLWIEHYLQKQNMTIDQMITEEHNRQTMNDIIMGHVIRSLKSIDDVDWVSWFENVSHVDHLLRDKSDFALIDPQSRNAYRVAIEEIARMSHQSEIEVACQAIELSKNAQACEGQDEGQDRPKQRIGASTIAYYLLDEGRIQLEAQCQCRLPFLVHFSRFYRKMGIWNIALPCSLLTMALLMVIYGLLRYAGVAPASSLFLSFLAAIPAINIIVSAFSTVISWFVPAARLIGFEYKDGLPDDARTLVVIPTILSSEQFIDDTIHQLELHYLNESIGAIEFALLTDWKDAPFETMEQDASLLHHAEQAIEKLNHQYCSGKPPRFFILHRRRLFNKSEQCWMGWERKRGKLYELNLLLRLNESTSFLPHHLGDPTRFRFVMTLDSDTGLTPKAVTKLVGKLNHPQNRPIFDQKNRKLIRGYSILQPRITPSLAMGAHSSYFQRIFSANRGFDPYVFASFDLYQDLLGEGTFTGKGLYDIDAFQLALEGRIGENSVLSHDMLEGSYARSALASDVEIIEDYPISYFVDAVRHHRWTRGDWQLLPYLAKKYRINAIARWKLLDNLRRSLTAVAWIFASLAGWCLLPISVACCWQMVLLLNFVVAPLFNLVRSACSLKKGYLYRGHLRSILNDLGSLSLHAFLQVTFLAHTACYCVDAVLRALYRMGISHRFLLEWSSSAIVGSRPDRLIHYIHMMSLSACLAIVITSIPFFLHSDAAWLALPFGVLWFFAPFIAWFVSRPLISQESLSLRARDKNKFRQIARRTWYFYETFVTPENHYLPPDNFQEDPEPILAQRTSPTNIGVYLLAIVAARDFGWISLRDAIQRIGSTLDTIGKMEKHQGHLYNWYKTDTLEPLAPLYISTVDSGNLAGHLIVLSGALKEWLQKGPAALEINLSGVNDAAGILATFLEEVRLASPSGEESVLLLQSKLKSAYEDFCQLVQTMEHNKTSPHHELSTQMNELIWRASEISQLVHQLAAKIGTENSQQAVKWAQNLVTHCEFCKEDIQDRADYESFYAPLERLAAQARHYAFEMEFGFLERKERRLLSIGYRVQENALDESCYDLLASEARLASLFAIAKGDVSVKHWFQLGRPLVSVGWYAVLLSWSGSMFEYLMPPLVMNEPVGSLLDQTNRSIIRRQIAYTRKSNRPWGISEAAFNARDPMMNYQYSAFGVPSLGLQRGLSRNAVIAPYASLLAAQYEPEKALANLENLQNLGALGSYGYYDSVDFTASRLPEGRDYAIIRNYYAHHHGMSLIALENIILGGRMREYFHKDPAIQAVEFLLHEKAPKEIPLLHTKIATPVRANMLLSQEAKVSVIESPLEKPPATLFLCQNSYQMRLTAKGSGYSRWNQFAITRFQPDAAQDQQGTFFFLRDKEIGRWWSATVEPTRIQGEETKTVFSTGKADFYKTVFGIQSKVEVISTHHSSGEGHQIELLNLTARERRIEITSYAELALAMKDRDADHPAFSRLFVETEIADQGTRIFAWRRKAIAGEAGVYIVHFVTSSSGCLHEIEAETDRRAFIGRGRTLSDPAAFDPDRHFYGHDGTVLDPITAIRCVVHIPPYQKVKLVFWTLAGSSREELQTALAHYLEPDVFDREFLLSWTHRQVTNYQIGLTAQEIMDYQTYATYLMSPERVFLSSEMILNNPGSQSDLWSLSISGDYPIFVLRFDHESTISEVRGLLRAYEYWRSYGFIVDIVIVDEQTHSYTQTLNAALEGLYKTYQNSVYDEEGKPHIFVLKASQIDPECLRRLFSVSHIVLHSGNGSLSKQLRDREDTRSELPIVKSLSKREIPEKRKLRKRHAMDDASLRHSASLGQITAHACEKTASKGDDLLYWNGYGGFDKQDGSYVIRLGNEACTPHPWINVISNDHFGMHVSAEGAPFTWSGNSRDYQLTPWSNDPVSNRPGEGLYCVDLESNSCFSPVAAIKRHSDMIYEARHGLGYSSFHTSCDLIETSLTYTVDPEKPVRLSRLRIHNKTKKARHLRLYSYIEWVMGHGRAKNAPFIVPVYDKITGTFWLQNPYNREHSNSVSFFYASILPSSVTSSRVEFIGNSGTIEHPQAILDGKSLSNTVQAGKDPCTAMAYDIHLAADEAKDIVFYLGHASTKEEALLLIAQNDGLNDGLNGGLNHVRQFETVLDAQKKRWHDFTGGFQVKTPDPSFDLLVNHWLPYQIYGCRMMARAGFYQASGAYGFRDQLQDSLSLLLLKPELARKQLLYAASRQFIEGDVQHWWLPGSGAGVRTLISDDIVWLAYGAALYVNRTGDETIWEEPIHFLMGPVLQKGQYDCFFQPDVSPDQAVFYEHCVRALDLAVKRSGKRGLPLILGGDWNDGMNHVGIKGKGESVWLGWFLGLVLDNFIPIAEKRGDRDHVVLWQNHLEQLKKALNHYGWDGAWYRRGFYDEGTPLGSAQSDACQIDIIAQSWSVLSGLAPIERQRQAMDSMLEHLIDKQAKLVRLFWPPFDKTQQDPGYIKAYPPGIRENGGQYTHGALWSILALIQLGKTEQAYELFAMINPIHHGKNPELYRVEPYVVAADIYSVAPHLGQGGWTWYTGSAGWYYRVAIEGILGIVRQGDRVFITPALPKAWSHYQASWSFKDAVYSIEVEQTGESVSASYDDRVIMDPEAGFPLYEEGYHKIKITLPIRLEKD